MVAGAILLVSTLVTQPGVQVSGDITAQDRVVATVQVHLVQIVRIASVLMPLLLQVRRLVVAVVVVVVVPQVLLVVKVVSPLRHESHVERSAKNFRR